MDGIAKTVGGMEKNGFARDLFRAQPLRLRELAPEACVWFDFPPPLELFKAATKIAGQQPGMSLVVMRVGKIRADGERSGITRQRLLEPPQLIKRCAAVAERIEVVRLDGKGAVKVRQCLLEAPQVMQDDGSIAIGRGAVRPQLKRALTACQGLLEALELS